MSCTYVCSRVSLVSLSQAAQKKCAGKDWFEMKAPPMTPELRNDLKLLKMRNALNPSQHYKATDWKRLPRYFQVGDSTK